MGEAATGETAMRAAMRTAPGAAGAGSTGTGGGAASPRPGVARIPVVVHVVHATDEEDISAEQVRGQLDVLNRELRLTRPGGALDGLRFSGLLEETRLELCLATVDPAGNATTGITRTRTGVTSFSDDDGVKRYATGGVDAWPAERYLNIWVCRLRDGLLGYAQAPGGPAETDGVVVTHSRFGISGTAARSGDHGRTASQYVNHYLNVFPLWNDEPATDVGPPTPTASQAGARTGDRR